MDVKSSIRQLRGAKQAKYIIPPQIGIIQSNIHLKFLKTLSILMKKPVASNSFEVRAYKYKNFVSTLIFSATRRRASLSAVALSALVVLARVLGAERRLVVRWRDLRFHLRPPFRPR